MLNRKNVESFFASYVAPYDATDPKIKLKIDHTYRVASLCDAIATSVASADANYNTSRDRHLQSCRHAASASHSAQYPRSTITISPDLAWLCGMLHDIGRFEQIRRYNTFSDSASVDHAQFGADLLFREDLLELVPVTLTEKEKRILEKSIRNHSAYRLEPSLTEEEFIYCDILRDADKVDIFRVNCDTPLEDIYNVTTEELKTSPVSDAVKQCFLNKTAVLRSLRQYPADYVISMICLYYELVYPISREQAKEQGYLDRLLSFQSDNPDTQSWFSYMREHIWD